MHNTMNYINRQQELVNEKAQHIARINQIDGALLELQALQEASEPKETSTKTTTKSKK